MARGRAQSDRDRVRAMRKLQGDLDQTAARPSCPPARTRTSATRISSALRAASGRLRFEAIALAEDEHRALSMVNRATGARAGDIASAPGAALDAACAERRGGLWPLFAAGRTGCRARASTLERRSWRRSGQVLEVVTHVAHLAP